MLWCPSCMSVGLQEACGQHEGRGMKRGDMVERAGHSFEGLLPPQPSVGSRSNMGGLNTYL